jgi:hypothetical protein
MRYKSAVMYGAVVAIALGTTSAATARLIPISPSIEVTIPLSCVDSKGVVVVHYNINEIHGNTKTPIEDKGYVKGQLTYFDASGGESVRRLTPQVRVYYDDGTRKAYSESVPLGGACE